MFYLIYVSSAVKLMNDDELFNLLEQCRKKNITLGITGMLLYKSGSFMQMLEGDKEIVLELYNTISEDERHKDVSKIISGDIKQRNFKDWSMGFYNMNKLGGLPEYKKLIEKNLSLNSFQEDSGFAYRFITRFNENNP
jgi:hypothetical protein